MKRKVVSLLAALLLLIPTVTLAAGLVPCGGPGEPLCQACYAVELLNGVLDWLVGVLSVVFALMVMVAGYNLVTSSGNTSAKEKAKSMITNAFIGFVIVLAAWLLIDYGMRFLVADPGGTVPFGTWNAVQCVEQPTVNWSPTDIDFGVSVGLAGGGTVESECELIGPGVYDCTSTAANCTAGNGVPEYVTQGGVESVRCDYPSAAYSGSCELITDTSNPCHPSNLTAFGARAQDASRICNKESGGAAVESGSDLCCGPGGNCSGAPSFSGGYFQVNILAHANMIPGCDLSSFFTRNGSGAQGTCVRRNSNGICTGWSCSIVRNAAYNTCMQGARNSQVNMSIASQLYSSRGFQPWANSRNLCNVSN